MLSERDTTDKDRVSGEAVVEAAGWGFRIGGRQQCGGQCVDDWVGVRERERSTLVVEQCGVLMTNGG